MLSFNFKYFAKCFILALYMWPILFIVLLSYFHEDGDKTMKDQGKQQVSDFVTMLSNFYCFTTIKYMEGNLFLCLITCAPFFLTCCVWE